MPCPEIRNKDRQAIAIEVEKERKRAISSVTRVDDFCTLGNFLKPFATINLSKSPTFLGNFCKGAKILHFSNEIIFRQL